ncbi:histidine phosphatase family protein [Streptomyces sp. SL13]|jgi:broad specificity phosphatase PhoE|uniref:Histidine phosphatase family protein n=1 Tax=Streptantibioticus silvisoli TaxID=2705255 RepID=A0AA90H7I6_9ACTN|nr:histidine phosphatase family protein [Streptantibioticus silvisoli]MDI5971959.1 histidine phosphatase family protein [Streptantibioticus silvisoli]
MGELILIRHGETEWSREMKHTSWTDLPLTERGEEQARALVPLLAGRRIGAVLASPMRRAQRTAELAGLDGPVIDDDLHEWDYGAYEGVTTDDIHRDRPGWDLWADGVAPGPREHPGESPEEIGERADRALKLANAALRDTERAGTGDVALVAHGHILRVLAARRLGLPASGGAMLHLDTATVSFLGFEHGHPAVTGWNIKPQPAV